MPHHRSTDCEAAVDDPRRDGGHRAAGRRDGRGGSSGFESFAVLEGGRVVADGELAEVAAEALLYVARIADAIGYQLGSGSLEWLEVFGRSSALATVDAGADGALTVRGCVTDSGSLPEQARVWLESRSSP
jgi:hypothetical protein